MNSFTCLNARGWVKGLPRGKRTVFYAVFIIIVKLEHPSGIEPEQLTWKDSMLTFTSRMLELNNHQGCTLLRGVVVVLNNPSGAQQGNLTGSVCRGVRGMILVAGARVELAIWVYET